MNQCSMLGNHIKAEQLQSRIITKSSDSELTTKQLLQLKLLNTTEPEITVSRNFNSEISLLPNSVAHICIRN